jgi:lipoic acid synthetase
MNEKELIPVKRTQRYRQGEKLRDGAKVERIPVKVIASDSLLRKPDWIRIRVSNSPKVDHIKKTLREHRLYSVCEEASCPNLGECFAGGTATFRAGGNRVCSTKS